jgi:nitrate reductase NapE component
MYKSNRRTSEWLAFQALQAALFQLVVVGVAFFYGSAILLMGAVYAFMALLFVLVGWEFKYLLIGNLAAGIVRRIHR